MGVNIPHKGAEFQESHFLASPWGERGCVVWSRPAAAQGQQRRQAKGKA